VKRIFKNEAAPLLPKWILTQ